jgi:crotonobetainyl-CoA:carnitine CoA-transferase CaiB-like acyl-CoA transferase
MGKRVLEGIRILEWGMLQQGPVAASLLADLGAEVIKIESRQGDNERQLKVFYKQHNELPDGSVACFEFCNRNKKGITVDLSTQEGKELLYKVAAKSDVFLTNFRPGTPEKLGVGFEDLKKVNPKIIYAYATGLGINGPDRNQKSIDMTGLARSGAMFSAGNIDDAPGFIQAGYCDQMGAVSTAFGVIAALLARERLGIGQMVEVNMISAFSILNWNNVNLYSWTGKPIERNDINNPVNPLTNYYECTDEKWIMLGAYLPRDIKVFFTLAGKPEIADNPKYTTVPGIMEDSPMLTKIVKDLFLTKNRNEWIDILKTTEITFAPVQTVEEVHRDPQMLENHGFYTLKHPSREEPVKMLSLPFYLTETPPSIEKWAPKLGENNKDVYTNIAGLTPEQVEDYAKRGII